MDLLQDIRYGVRRLVDAKWFTLAAVLALGLGIGANAAVFTFVNAVLLRGLPFEEPDEIVMVWSENDEAQRAPLSHLDYVDYREQSRSFEELAASLTSTVNLADGDEVPERVAGAYVSGNFFRMVGEEPVLGRDFRDDDDLPSAQPVVMIGHSVWQNRYAGDPEIIGRTVRVNGLAATVVGVMPPSMRFPSNTDLWIPRVNLPPAMEMDVRSRRSFTGIGRLADGVSEDQARTELRTIAGRLEAAYPDANQDMGVNLASFQEETNGSEIRVVFLSLLGAVIFVLLIACANVGSLLLARSLERSREIAVRVSMGATRSRIVRQLLSESLILAVAAGILGLGLSVLGIRWFDSVTQDVGKPYWMEFTLDPVVFGYTAVVCLGTVLLFGLAPALHVSRTDVNSVLKDGSRGGSAGLRARKWTGALIVGELVLTLILLSGAGFMMRSFMNLYALDTGVDTEGVVTMQIYLPLTQYPELEPRRVVYRDFLDRLDALPEVESSTVVTALPVGGGGGSGVEVDGRVTEPVVTPPNVTTVSVTEEYFDVMGLDLLQGRVFDREDGMTGAEVAIVNQRFVDLHLGGGEALGRQIRVGYEGSPLDSASWLRVVGIAPTVRQRNLEEPQPDPVVYLPLNLAPARSTFVAVRARGGDPGVVSAPVRESMARVDPDLPLSDLLTLEQRLAQQRWPFRVFGTLFAVFAVIALTLSAVGLHSVTANSVIQRIREFGIRISLGAQPNQISWLALRRVLLHLAIGLPLGMAGAFGVGMLLQSLLVQTTPGDPVTLGAVALVMALVAVLASLWPARRAARLNPVTALRVE